MTRKWAALLKEWVAGGTCRSNQSYPNACSNAHRWRARDVRRLSDGAQAVCATEETECIRRVLLKFNTTPTLTFKSGAQAACVTEGAARKWRVSLQLTRRLALKRGLLVGASRVVPTSDFARGPILRSRASAARELWRASKKVTRARARSCSPPTI